MAQYLPIADHSADGASLVRALFWIDEEEQLELPDFPPKPVHGQKIFFHEIISAGAITGRPIFLSAIELVVSEPHHVIEYAKEMLYRELLDNKGIVSSWYSWEEEEHILRLYTFTSTLDYDLETLIFRLYSQIVEKHEDIDFELRVVPLNDQNERVFLPPDSTLIFTN